MLTKKQYDLLIFIHERIQETGVSPSFDEMKDALSLKSKSGIHRLITALEERGFIRRLPHRARALEVARLPENLSQDQGRSSNLVPFSPPQTAGAPFASKPVGAPSGQSGPSLVGDDDEDDEFSSGPTQLKSRGKPAPPPRLGAAAAVAFQSRGGSQTVEILGRIAAGRPIEALQNHMSVVEAPTMMLIQGGEHFALEVRGDSMVDMGVLDGDIVVIHRQETAKTGDVVVALVDDNEATLKRLRRKGDSIALEAANPAYETRVYRADRVSIQGRLVGLLRSY